MILPRTELWAALVFIASVTASVLEKRAQKILVGFRSVPAKEALLWLNAGNTVVWANSGSGEQTGRGSYVSPKTGDWPGTWQCAIFADLTAWNLVNKAWLPQSDGCTPLWWARNVANQVAYLADLGGTGFTPANTIVLSRIDPASENKVQFVIPPELNDDAGGGLGFVTECALATNTEAVAVLQAYGTVDWYSWTNVKGTPQPLN